MPSFKSIRKMKRRAENDALAKDSRFWKSKTIWADRGALFRPANKSAANMVDGKWEKYKGGDAVSVYLYLIKTKGHDESFLKIGITNSLKYRFELDTVRYKFRLQNSVGGLTRKEAIDVEGRLHEMFSAWSYRPKFGFVSGGHTECFEICDFVVNTTNTVFALIEEEKARIGRPRTEMRQSELPDPQTQPDEEYIKAQELRDRAEKAKTEDRMAAINRQIDGAVERRRNRQRRSPPRKPPSVALLKNQNL